MVHKAFESAERSNLSELLIVQMCRRLSKNHLFGKGNVLRKQSS